MKTYGGVEAEISVFLNSALDGSGQLHTPAALDQRKKKRYPLDRGLGGP
jgi:hypothetical protein